MAGLGYVFRGVFPAASLKRHRRHRRHRSLDVFRGVFPAASLKRGGRDSRHARVNRHVFRGVFPAASLKRDRFRIGELQDALVFRGVFPAASLKLTRIGFLGLGLRSFPRGIPRGLIEAAEKAGYLARVWLVFRGVFPAASLKRVGVSDS